MNVRLRVVLLFTAVACSPPRQCSPQNCTGCCDGAGVCHSSAADACGLNGAICAICRSGQTCTQGACVGGSGGGHAGSGGASGNTGGGGGSSGVGGGSGTGGGATSSGKANVMLLLDKSGSMTTPLPGGTNCGTCAYPGCDEASCPTRMGAMRLGLTNFLSARGAAARFGLTVFPADNVCAPAGSMQQLVAINPGDDGDATLQQWANMVTAAVANVTPVGGTPTASSLEFVGTLSELNDASRGRFVVLLTDGLPNCNATNPNTCVNATACKCTLANANCGTMVNDTDSNNFCRRGCLDATATQTAVLDLRSRGIETIVIGFGADLASSPDAVSVLSSMASAGGWTRPCSGNDCGGGIACSGGTCAEAFYSVANAAELTEALTDIGNRL